MPAIGKILVPVDFSECSAAAPRSAVALSKDLEASVEVVHVVEPPTPAVPSGLLFPTPSVRPRSLRELAMESAISALDKLLGGLVGADVQRMITVGYPRQVLLALARSGAYDLVVMGTHGRTGLHRVFLGSTAERIARDSPCPVLTIRREIDRRLAAAS